MYHTVRNQPVINRNYQVGCCLWRKGHRYCDGKKVRLINIAMAYARERLAAMH